MPVLPSTKVKKTMRSSGKKSKSKDWNIEKAVINRYAAGAEEREEALCCPVSYDQKYLKKIPQEIIEKDYGCGDPSQYVREGDVVLDLGSGTGKICYIASQVVGPQGKVIGVDFNPSMLSLARKYREEVGREIGWRNVEFRRGKIQDLRTNYEAFEKELSKRSVRNLEDWMACQEVMEEIQRKNPLVADDCIDVIVSNCVLNLVRTEEKEQLFMEMHRVLKKGGRVAISDIVSDEVVPKELCRDEKLWSGCISGAFEEKEFLKAFEDAGFYGIKIEKRDQKPWKTVKGIEFRSVTVTAFKGKEGECWERNQAVIYKGPWKQVRDDDDHVLKRGVRMAVCDKTFQIYAKPPYRDQMILVEPRKSVPLSKAKPFSCDGQMERHPRESKGLDYDKTQADESSCLDGGCC